MDKAAEVYKGAVKMAVETAQVFLDMEGGRVALTLLSELLAEELACGNESGAAAAMRKLLEAAEVEEEETAGELEEAAAQRRWFSAVLADMLEEEF